MMMKKMCIVGTDTGIGKTYTCCRILSYLANRDRAVLGLKPIASGVVETSYGKMNEDVYHLYMASNIKLPFNQINPFSFNSAIAPHIAAKIENVELDIDNILMKTMRIINSLTYDYVLIEGVGGLMVPLNMKYTYLDLLIKWDYPVILTVGVKLGGLNHALLTHAVLMNTGLKILGWVANCVDGKMDVIQDNMDYLKARLNVPLLAIIEFDGNIQPTQDFFKVFR